MNSLCNPLLGVGEKGNKAQDPGCSVNFVLLDVVAWSPEGHMCGSELSDNIAQPGDPKL